MELPNGKFGLWREVAAAVPSIDSEPSCPEHLRMGYEIAAIHLLAGGTKFEPSRLEVNQCSRLELEKRFKNSGHSR